MYGWQPRGSVINVAAYLYCAPLMSLLCADASDDASMHSGCIVPQSFPINRPFLIHFKVHTSEINKNFYFYSVSRILCFGIIFLGVLQHLLCFSLISLYLAIVRDGRGLGSWATSKKIRLIRGQVVVKWGQSTS